jgi:hypothetical protein
MNRILLLIFLLALSVYYFYAAFSPDRTGLNKHIPIKNRSLRKSLFIIAGAMFLCAAFLVLYPVIVPRPR